MEPSELPHPDGWPNPRKIPGRSATPTTRAPLAREQLRFLLRYAILAPSNRNTQPWQFAVGRDQVTIHADFSRWQEVSDSHKRELHISLGCALENLLVALEHFGFAHIVIRAPGADDPSIAAQVAILDQPVASPRGAHLFEAIVKRHTHHGLYRRRAVAPKVLQKLMDCKAEHDLELLLTPDGAIKRAVDKLMLEGDALAFSNPRYRKELADCIGEESFGGTGRSAPAKKTPPKRGWCSLQPCGYCTRITSTGRRTA
jgi:hypothetical protein